MKIALIYPPTADPTMPYLSVPSLTGFLRSNGVTVLPFDANIEAYDRLLTRVSLEALTGILRRRLSRLAKKHCLSHTDQLAYGAMTRALDLSAGVCPMIDAAVAAMRDRSKTQFFIPERYERAVCTVEAGLQIISAAYTPLSMDFLSYKTPFALLDIEQIRDDADPRHNPFHNYFAYDLCERLKQAQVDIVGISAAFTGQIQSAYALGFLLCRLLPDVHLVLGGPAATQIFCRLSEAKTTRAMGPFDSVVLFEGETALLDLISDLKRGQRPESVIRPVRPTELSNLPPPDFNGLPLDKYLSPEPVLPYDPTRGCYWGRCTFCHYGLTEKGTALYRERKVENVLEHLAAISKTQGCRIFYFSQDTMTPRFARRLAKAFENAGIDWRWASDMRPEAGLNPECCRELARGGALSVSLGIESGNPRILRLMEKGIGLKTMTRAVNHLSDAGIAVECMLFTDFPTETFAEAMATVDWIKTAQDRISLFICGRFDLVAGAQVAAEASRFGIREIWTISGDMFIKTLFYAEHRPPKHVHEAEKIDAAVERLARGFWLHKYPWAGSLSTAHTLLWYDHFGPDVFRRFSGTKRYNGLFSGAARRRYPAYDSEKVTRIAKTHEAEIWQTLMVDRRSVSRQAYHDLAEKYPAITKSRKKSRTHPNK